MNALLALVRAEIKLHFSNRRTASDALMAKVWRAHTMFLQQKHLWITQTACRGDLSSVARRAESPEQARFGTSFERCMDCHNTRGFQFTAETPT